MERLGVETIDLYYLHRSVAYYGAKAYKLLTHFLSHRPDPTVPIEVCR